jgi:hypothetical protein
MAEKIGLGTFINDETELTSHGLDLFSVPPVDSTLVDGVTVYYYPIGSITDSGPYEFHIPQDNDSYMYLPMTRLEGAVEVVKAADGETLTAADNTSVVNLFPQTLFKQVECEVNGTQVCDLSTPTYAYKSFLETQLSYSKAAKESHLQCSLYESDDSAHMDTWDNEGSKIRLEATLGKKYFFSNVIHSDFFQCHRYLLPNSDVRLKFIRNEDKFSLFGQAQNKGKVKMHNLRLCVRKIKIDPKMKAIHENTLKTMPAIYPLTQSKIKTFTIPSGTVSTEIPSILHGNLPRSVVICFVESNSFNGDARKNPFNFKHFGINNLNLKINGSPVVPTPFQPDFANGNCKREYRWFLDNCGITHENESNGITFKDFQNGSTFFCFDLTPDLCNSFHQHKTKSGSMDINLGFSAATTLNIHMLIFASYNQAIVIDHARNVSVLE